MERGDHITQLLRSWSQGDRGAMEQLMPLVFEELHRVARRYMSGERPGHTLQTTALVNETYLRLVSLRADDAPNPGGLDAVAPGAEARRRDSRAGSRQRCAGYGTPAGNGSGG